MNINELLAYRWTHDLSFVDEDAANLISQLGLRLILGSLFSGLLAFFTALLRCNFPLLCFFGLIFDSVSPRLDGLSVSIGSSLDTKFNQLVGHSNSIFAILNEVLPLIHEPGKYLFLHRSLQLTCEHVHTGQSTQGILFETDKVLFGDDT